MQKIPARPSAAIALSAVVLSAAALLAGCATPMGGVPVSLGTDPAQACAALAAPVPASAIGLPSGAASIDSATFVAASATAVAERGPTPAARITPALPALPAHCRLLGRIAPINPQAPAILFQVNLPVRWNGRSVQYGGGGFNGVLINGLGLLPVGRFDVPAPLAQGFVTVGTDSGHQNQPGQPPQTFALNDEALVNFAHASYKKVRDVSVALMQRAYGRAPEKLYFLGSSEGGREGLTMAQRYPDAFDGIFSRSCRQRRPGECGHAGRLDRLGRTRPGPGRAAAGGPGLRRAVCRHPRAPAVRVAALAALPGRRHRAGGQFSMRAVTHPGAH